MIAIIKQNEQGEITGWMMGSDTHELRRRAEAAMDHELAEMLYRMEFPPLGKTVLSPGLTMLVE